MKKENIFIGCSGFYNNDWKGSLYPEDAKSKDFLILYSRQFNTVEINSTFYRKPTLKTLMKWHEETPEDFKFFIKIPKTVSHEKRLQGCREEVAEFCLHLSSGLQEKLAGFLYQFPPSFKNTPENIQLILETIDPAYLNVIEFRHASWWQEEIFRLLSEHQVVFSGVSFPGNLPEDVISNNPGMLYYRLHGKPVLYKSEYSRDFIENLAETLKSRQQQATYVFFNNTWGTAAIHNALYLKEILGSK